MIYIYTNIYATGLKQKQIYAYAFEYNLFLFIQVLEALVCENFEV